MNEFPRDLSVTEYVDRGPASLRQMWNRHSRYSDFRIYTRVDSPN
jgi:hypothetical protein